MAEANEVMAVMAYPMGSPRTRVVRPASRTPSPNLPDAVAGVVVKIVDGDTIHAAVGKGGTVEKIRLLGIDAPERLQEYGSEATDTLKELIPVGTAVRLQLQGGGGGDRGRYGRLLAHIFLEGDDVDAKSVSLTMVERGAAWHYSAFNNDVALAEAETKARKAKVGLWAKEEEAVRPSVYRMEKKILRVQSSRRRAKPTPTWPL